MRYDFLKELNFPCLVLYLYLICQDAIALREENLVFFSCASGDICSAGSWLVEDEGDINIVTRENGFSLLHLAVLYGQMEMAELLVKCGIDVTLRQKVISDLH